MKVEIFIFLLWILGMLIWAAWFRWSTKRLQRRYKPENDRSRKFGEEEQGIGKGIGGNKGNSINPAGSFQLGERETFQTPNIDSVGEDSTSTGTTSKSNRGFFGKLRRRKTE